MREHILVCVRLTMMYHNYDENNLCITMVMHKGRISVGLCSVKTSRVMYVWCIAEPIIW